MGAKSIVIILRKVWRGCYCCFCFRSLPLTWTNGPDCFERRPKEESNWERATPDAETEVMFDSSPNWLVLSRLFSVSSPHHLIFFWKIREYIITRLESLKTALYLRLKKRKHFLEKKLEIFENFFFRKMSHSAEKCKRGTLLDLLTYILLQNIKKLEGGPIKGKRAD